MSLDIIHWMTVFLCEGDNAHYTGVNTFEGAILVKFGVLTKKMKISRFFSAIHCNTCEEVSETVCALKIEK